LKDGKGLMNVYQFSGWKKTMKMVRGVLFLLLPCILFFPAACAILPISPYDGPTDSAAGPGGMAYQIPRVAPEELKNLLDGGAEIIIVDTMSPEWYRKGHIKGAINFPWREPLGDPENLLPRDKSLVIYCDCPNEETSADVAQQLVRRWKYENIRVLKGGWDKWVRLGFPTEKGEVRVSRKASF
jgi:rhodanese-related sulfurtransferase